MTIASERRYPFEVIDIYNRKILANQSKAAIRRIIRENQVRTSDLSVFSKLSALLGAAHKGDQSISAAQIRTSDAHSLKILMQTMQAMEGRLTNTRVFRERLDELSKSAQELAQGKVIPVTQLNMLYDFCKKYADVQQQLLKQPFIKSSYGATMWPFVRQIKSI